MKTRQKKIIRSWFLASALWLLPGVAQAQDEAPEVKPKINAGIEVDTTRYIWRGLAFSRAPIEMTKLWVSVGRVTVTAVGIVVNEETEIGKFKELDLLAVTTHEWKKLRVEPLLAYFHFYRPATEWPFPATGEAGVKVSYPVGRARFFTFQVLDVGHYRGAYFGQVGTTYERHLSERLKLNSSVAVGWASAKFNETYIGPSRPAWNVVETRLALTYALHRRVSLRPHVEFSRILDQQLRRHLTTPDIVNLGAAVGFHW